MTPSITAVVTKPAVAGTDYPGGLPGHRTTTLTQFDKITRLFAQHQMLWGCPNAWGVEAREKFGRAVVEILLRGREPETTEKELTDLRALRERQREWGEWEWALWNYAQAEMSRVNIETWLATTHLRPHLSAEGLEHFFRVCCPERYAQHCHFPDIQEVK